MTQRSLESIVRAQSTKLANWLRRKSVTGCVVELEPATECPQSPFLLSRPWLSRLSLESGAVVLLSEEGLLYFHSGGSRAISFSDVVASHWLAPRTLNKEAHGDTLVLELRGGREVELPALGAAFQNLIK